ncbi:MAG: hypothetical protein RR373_04195 [Akkermansia sp.]
MTQNRHYTEKSEKKVSVYKGFISALLYSIGEVRKQGNVVEQNMQKARQWLKRAEDQGNEEAKKILEQMLLESPTFNE